jgi:hypothetical protein
VFTCIATLPQPQRGIAEAVNRRLAGPVELRHPGVPRRTGCGVPGVLSNS